MEENTEYDNLASHFVQFKCTDPIHSCDLTRIILKFPAEHDVSKLKCMFLYLIQIKLQMVRCTMYLRVVYLYPLKTSFDFLKINQVRLTLHMSNPPDTTIIMVILQLKQQNEPL